MRETVMDKWSQHFGAMCKKDTLLERFFERHGIPSPLSAETTLEAFESALMDLEARLGPIPRGASAQEDDGA